MTTSSLWASEVIGALYGHSGIGVYIRVYIRQPAIRRLWEWISSEDGVTLRGQGLWHRHLHRHLHLQPVG